QVVGNPRIADISVNEGEPMKFKAIVEVLPEFELKEYMGLKATKRIARVTDEEVGNVLERFRQSTAEFVPVEDRPSQDGDFVSVNLVGKYIEPQEKQEKEDLISDDVQIEIGSENVQPEFNENLRGVMGGDVREFRVKYPEDFSSQGLAGNTLDFTATVIAVRRKEIPELDDEFAQDFGDYENIQQLRDKIRENLVSTSETRANARLRDELVERLLQDYDFEVPEVLVEPQAAERTREFAYMLMRSGVPRQTINEINWEERMNEARVHATRDVRAALVVAKVGDAENIEISREEVDAEIERVAMMNGESADQLKARLTKDESLSSIENRLRYQKALDAVINHAEIAVEEFTEDQHENQAQSPGQPEADGEARSESKSAEQS
ncbi:MAG: trigger factor, partial [Blastocatellia bacterium]